MRIFSRRPRQSVTIGTVVTVTVLEIRGSQVRIGVTAPREISIQRGEIVGTPRAIGGQRDAGS
jgi:carbon storage regulator